MPLFIGKNHGAVAPVQSLFRLVGNDEDALTYGLGFLMAHDSSFCTKLLRSFGLSLPRTFVHSYAVHLQEVTDKGFGRRDIVVAADGIRIVIEAKIGRSVPTAAQLIQYAAEKQVWEQYKRRYIVALTQVELSPSARDEVREKLAQLRLGINFKEAQWHNILELVIHHRPSDASEVSQYLFDEFSRYARRDYNMGYYDAEVLIQDVNPLNAKIYEQGWVYVTALKDKAAPLYFAPYFTNANDRPGISWISRVLDIQTGKPANLSVEKANAAAPTDEHRRKWAEGLQMVQDRAIKDEFADSEVRLFYLDRPLPLGKTISKASYKLNAGSKIIPAQITKSFSLRFDELLGNLLTETPHP